MDNESKLGLLRINLYGAAQMLTGDDADSFWKLIDEIILLRPDPPQEGSER